MATILRTDSERGPGYARICLDAGSSPLPSMPQGCAFTLQRASDALFLAHNGWQESQTELTPDALTRQDSVLELRVGPDVVDNLDILNTYRIHLRHTTLPPTVIQIESLDYSPLKGKEGLHIAAPVAAPVLPPVVEAPPAQEPVLEETVVEEPVAAKSLEPSPPPLTMAIEEAHPAGKKNTFWVLLLLLLVAGAGAAAGLYWYNQHLAKPVAQESPASPPALPPASPEAPKTAEAPAAPLSPLAQARQHLQGSGDATKSLDLARQLQTGQSAESSADPAMQSQRADAVFLLLEDAAQKGQGEAMILLARYFDPVDKAPKGSIQSDPQQALQWYTAARAAGQASAADSGINGLRQWASTAAAAGDTSAQELLRRPELK